MPVIGTIDPSRGQQILRALVQLEPMTSVTVVILDLTGVPELSAEAADILRRATTALRLRGVWAILTGIRPSVASCLFALRIDLTAVPICRTLQEGIALANRSILSATRR